MARFHRPEPGVDRAAELGAEQPAVIPYSYGTPCYWAAWGARAAAAARQAAEAAQGGR